MTDTSRRPRFTGLERAQNQGSSIERDDAVERLWAIAPYLCDRVGGGLHLSGDVLAPDVAGWRRDRLPALPEDAFFSLSPDWICEVVSPATAAMDRGKKLGIYARERVAHAWMVDPIARTLEVLRLESGRWSILSTASDLAVVRAEPFEALEWICP